MPTLNVRRARSSHIIKVTWWIRTGRIIGDYRRDYFYGIDRLIEERINDRNNIPVDSEANIRLREETTDQINSLKELIQLGDMYGFDLRIQLKTH